MRKKDGRLPQIFKRKQWYALGVGRIKSELGRETTVLKSFTLGKE
jgi:hypothetical protein